MKQKMVVSVTMNGQKSRSKALKFAVSVPGTGVESASFKGDDSNRIEVTGDGVDPVQLTSLLRKKIGHAELLSVSAADGEKEEENEQKYKEEPAEVYVSPYNPPYNYYCVYEVPYGHYHEPCYCSIM